MPGVKPEWDLEGKHHHGSDRAELDILSGTGRKMNNF